ncbi:MAG: SPOR domain-containing protein [Sedimentitalea sp.]|nr:SPOR domain-containing protein [Sedimentitalea sp.]
MDRMGSVGPQIMRLAVVAVAAGLLAGCEDGADMAFLKPKDKPAEITQAATDGSAGRDVEAPELFQVTEAGLWDGRPSLGGVWVAHPDVSEPQRVLVRNMANDQTVVGALFRRERDIPGPRIQISSDAAVELGMLAGAPVEISVTALRREVPADPTPQPVAETEPADSPAPEAAAPVAVAAAAAPEATAAAPAPETEAKTAKPSIFALSKPYVEVGIFGSEENATLAVGQLAVAGLSPTVLQETSNDKPFWRVVLGPAQTRADRTALLDGARKAGFQDAYITAN